MKANPDCTECEGTGVIKFFFDQDWTEDAECPKCFPDKKGKYKEISRRYYK